MPAAKGIRRLAEEHVDGAKFTRTVGEKRRPEGLAITRRRLEAPRTCPGPQRCNNDSHCPESRSVIHRVTIRVLAYPIRD